MWKLVIEDDEGKRTVVPLTRDDYTIGRQEGNTIRLTERNVSRQHGRVRRQRSGNGASRDTFILEDLRSYNGVFINGLRVAHTQDLQHGDLIQIGDYRIVLQDDAAATETQALPVATESDIKATIPMAQAFRGQTLTERPNRLVMLVGPTPGVEYPLDRERMTVGRAEEASISVNHNSVSRLHCEVHALGDGRFEIVDKGSSNGVRVNAVELKRSIIEAGDVIELGDVRFKFIGAGQVFVPGPNESQQLTAISDRDAELADHRRGLGGGYLLPIVGAGIVGAAIILGFVYYLKATHADNAPQAPTTPTADNAEQALVMEARKSCTLEDCERSHLQVTTQLPETSPWRDSTEFREIESIWADSILKKARVEGNPAVKRAMLQRLLDAAKVDAAKKRDASDMLNQVIDIPAPAPTDLPVAMVKDAGAAPSATAVVAPPVPTKPSPTGHTTVTNATTTGPASSPPPAPVPQRSDFERAREQALANNPVGVKSILGGKVRAGRGTLDEAKLLKAACKQIGDSSCVEDVKSHYPQLGQGGN